MNLLSLLTYLIDVIIYFVFISTFDFVICSCYFINSLYSFDLINFIQVRVFIQLLVFLI